MSNNLLSKEKLIAVAATLPEGNSIRSIERMTEVHRDTIMRLGVRIGQRCARLLGSKRTSESYTRLRLGYTTTENGGRRYFTILELPPVDRHKQQLKLQSCRR